MKIEIYSKPGCSYCVQAKDHFKNHNLPYTEYVIEEGNGVKEQLAARLEPEGVPLRQIPQIWVDDKYVGGYMAMVEWFLKRTQLKS